MGSVSHATTLILGGSGFLGPHLVAAAVRATPAPGRVVSVARRPDLAPAFHDEPERVVARPLDLLAPDRLEELLDAEEPDAVVLAAALSRVADCEADPERAEALNAMLPERVGRWCRSRPARFVSISTDLVFGLRPAHGERYTEDDPPAPAHTYGRTKARGEERALAACPAALVIRLPLLYGDSGGRGLGAQDSVFVALARGETPALFNDEWRTPLDVRLAADAVIEALGTDASGLLHVAGSRRMSRFELGASFGSRGLPGEPCEVAMTTRAAQGMEERPADVSLDNSRARALLRADLSGPSRLSGDEAP